ncbi:hypothetical protein WKW50_25790 [Ochrobactrum sp. GPK 3]
MTHAVSTSHPREAKLFRNNRSQAIRELLSKWRSETPLGPEDQFPDDIDEGLPPLKDIDL